METMIGLEIHGYLRMNETERKLFCNCSIFDSEPNSNTCPICTGQPGSKPLLPNREAIRKIIACGLMLGCKINNDLLWQRKHYSWPDLPNGYQKTMSGAYAVPVGVNGEFNGIGIEEVHLEEDPARWDPVTGNVDYNRCGFPLIEIVTKPEFKSSEEVRDWVKKLLTTLGYVNAINPDAGIKCDVNVSVSPKFLRTEVKNVNSITAIQKSIEYELHRQKSEPNTAMQTRAWDDATETTKFMRKKESQTEYMFIPEPDLPIVEVNEKFIKEIKKGLPERPGEKIRRFTEMGVDKIDAEILSKELELAELFEKVAKEIAPDTAAKWLRRELLRVLNYNDKTLKDVEIDENHIIELLKMVENKEITENVAKKIIEKLMEKSFSPREYVKKEGLGSVSDDKELRRICEEVAKENPNAVNDYKKGEEKSFNFLVGQIMRKTKGKAVPEVVNKLLKDIIR